MQIKQISDRYNVSPQISVEDVPAAKEAGITMVICNRPDAEVPPSHQSKAIQAAVEAAGMQFASLPITHQTMTPENVARQKELVESSDGPVLAYCASGTRCSVLWALSQAGNIGTDEILATTAKAGYDLSGLRPALESMAG